MANISIRVRFIPCILLAALMAAVTTAANAGEPSWDIEGSLFGHNDTRMTGNFLLFFRITDCGGRPDARWSVSRYAHVSNGEYSLKIVAKDFLPEDAALPENCSIQVRAPKGAPWKLSPVRFREDQRSKKHRHELENELDRLHSALVEENSEEPMRDALSSAHTPAERKKASRLNKILSKETKLLKRRLKYARQNSRR